MRRNLHIAIAFTLGYIIPEKNGDPAIMMPNGEDLFLYVRKSVSSIEVTTDHVITKTYKHYDIPTQITDNNSPIFTA